MINAKFRLLTTILNTSHLGRNLLDFVSLNVKLHNHIAILVGVVLVLLLVSMVVLIMVLEEVVT